MKTETKRILRVMALVILVIVAFSLQRECSGREIKKLEKELKKEKIRNDTLVKVNETQYRKMVADTASARELKKLVDSLQIVVEGKPKEVVVVKYKIKEKEVPGKTIIKDTIIESTGYYPQEENYFAKVDVSINTKNLFTKYNFKFRPIDLSMVISEGRDGIFRADIKVPEYMTVGNVDIVARPRETEKDKKNNFGFLIGAGVGKSFKYEEEVFGRFSTGIRYKKFYLDLGASTNQTIDLGFKVEL